MKANKRRIARLESAQAGPVQGRHISTVDGRYFETRQPGGPFDMTALVDCMTLTAEQMADKYPEITRAEYDALIRAGLVTSVQFDHSLLLTRTQAAQA